MPATGCGLGQVCRKSWYSAACTARCEPPCCSASYSAHLQRRGAHRVDCAAATGRARGRSPSSGSAARGERRCRVARARTPPRTRRRRWYLRSTAGGWWNRCGRSGKAALPSRYSLRREMLKVECSAPSSGGRSSVTALSLTVPAPGTGRCSGLSACACHCAAADPPSPAAPGRLP